MTETLGAHQVADILSWFRSLVIDAAERHRGIVDKFVGDGAMLIFERNSATPDPIANALAAFHHVSDGVDQKNSDGDSASKAIDIAAGLHVGPALIGAFGDDRRLEFTALGTTVNVASRLEAFAKERDLRLVVSHPSLKAEGRDRSGFHDLGEISVRGLSEPIRVLGLKAQMQNGAAA